MGKSPKIAPSLWDFITPPEEDQATAIGNIHKQFGKGCACSSGDMLAYRQTDRHTHTHRRAHYNTSMPLLRAKYSIVYAA